MKLLDAGLIIAERYEVREVLGIGGQGSVYRVWDQNLDVERALKMVSTEPTQQERFEREIRLLSTLTHAALLRVADVGQHEGRTYLVTPLMECSLASYIDTEGPMSNEEAIRQFSELLDGLAVVHQRAVVHRDIKPANVLVKNGRLVLADFGIARDQNSSRTLPGSALGTIEYMAPEQQIDAAGVTTSADIYGMGATLFHAATGQSPLHLFMAGQDSGRFANLPEQLGAVIWRATRLDAHRRFSSAEDMAAALRQSPSAVVPLVEGPAKNKICMLGASGVGKTSLVARFVHSIFTGEYRTTIGVQIERKDVVVREQKRTCVVWDLEGEDQWARTRLPMMRGAHGFVVVVDGTRRATATIACSLLEEAFKVSGPRPYAVLLNKADLMDQWTVQPEDLTSLFGRAAAVYRTSASTGAYVDDAFQSLVAAIER